MENKLKQILEILDGEKITNCFTILQKVKEKLNDAEYEEKQKIKYNNLK